MSWSTSPSLSLLPFIFSSSSSSSIRLVPLPFFHSDPDNTTAYKNPSFYQTKSPPSSSTFTKQICRAAEYKFPDPIPEFADTETEKLRTHLQIKLSKKDLYGDRVDQVVGICTEIFSTFLHTEYGGPGTLLVIPFIDMADTVNERGLPGGSQAARAAIKWAQDHIDKDWNEWTGNDGK